jgi:hypothetical protein
MRFNISDIAGADESGIPIRGNPPIFFGIGAVAFIDLLGFSDAILTEWGSSENSPLFRILRIKDNPTIKEKIRTTISLCTPPTSNAPEIIHFHFYPKFHTISDSIIISIAFSENDTHDDILCKLNSLVLHLRFVWQAAVDEGFVIRGGAEIGNIYWSDSEIIGPALINAYKLESKIAGNARVILGQNFLEILYFVEQVMPGALIPNFIKCHDGLIAFSPESLLFQTNNAIEKIINIKDKSKDNNHNEKYNELLDILENPNNLQIPTINDLRECMITLDNNDMMKRLSNLNNFLDRFRFY